MNICNSISSSSSFNNLVNSIKFLVGIIILISSATLSFKVIVFFDKRYESVAVHSNIFSFIVKLIPVNIGLDSWVEVAKLVCLIIFLIF